MLLVLKKVIPTNKNEMYYCKIYSKDESIYKLNVNIKDYKGIINLNGCKVYGGLCASRIVGCIQSGCRETADKWHSLSSH